MTPLLKVSGLKIDFRQDGRVIPAVRGVDFHVDKGETLALVGESGCGKTTTGKALLKLVPPTGGTIRFEGTDITKLDAPRMVPLRRKMQIVFQDPFASLNPRMRVGQAIAEGPVAHGLWPREGSSERIAAVLRQVGLDPAYAERFPHQFSGGQRARIGIARALAMEPSVIVADEAGVEFEGAEVFEPAGLEPHGAGQWAGDVGGGFATVEVPDEFLRGLDMAAQAELLFDVEFLIVLGDEERDLGVGVGLGEGSPGFGTDPGVVVGRKMALRHSWRTD